MRTLRLCKAQGITDKKIESCHVVLERPVPEFVGDLKDIGKFYDNQALALANILIETLPGATLDRLTARLLIHKASLLRIPEN